MEGGEEKKGVGVRVMKTDDKKKALTDLPVWRETGSCHVGAADGLDLLYVLEVAFIQQLLPSKKHTAQSDTTMFCCGNNCASSVRVCEM